MVLLFFLGSVAVMKWILAREERQETKADARETNTADLMALAREVSDQTPLEQEATPVAVSASPLYSGSRPVKPRP
jgi:hypothetical protein